MNRFLYIWVFFKIKNLIFKTFFLDKKKSNLTLEKYYIESKFAHGNFFRGNVEYLTRLLQKTKLIKNQSYLEIGSFEGSSVIFFSKFLNDSEYTCVDIWNGVEELKDLDFKIISDNFDKNIFHINSSKINKFIGTSREFFLKNKKTFSIIYIDGNHFFDEVLHDLDNGWKFLQNDGIMIIDDYGWNWYKKPIDNPGYAINIFLKKNYKNLKILEMRKQVVIQKRY